MGKVKLPLRRWVSALRWDSLYFACKFAHREVVVNPEHKSSFLRDFPPHHFEVHCKGLRPAIASLPHFEPSLFHQQHLSLSPLPLSSFTHFLFCFPFLFLMRPFSDVVPLRHLWTLRLFHSTCGELFYLSQKDPKRPQICLFFFRSASKCTFPLFFLQMLHTCIH